MRSAAVSYFNDSFQTDYLSIYRIDLRQICKFGRTMALDDEPENSFSIPQGTWPWQPIFGFFHRIEFRSHSVVGIIVR